MTPVAGVRAKTALRDAEVLPGLTEAARGFRPFIAAVVCYENKMQEYANTTVSLSRRNAENASSGEALQRRGFRLLPRLAQAFEPVMLYTLGKSASADWVHHSAVLSTDTKDMHSEFEHHVRGTHRYLLNPGA